MEPAGLKIDRPATPLRPPIMIDRNVPRDRVGALIRGADRQLQRLLGVRPFCADPHCILRIAFRVAAHEIRLTDGTRIHRGDPIGELHLWNEHLPLMPAQGPELRWAFAIRRAFAYSLALLAERAATDPALSQLKAFRTRIAFAGPWSRAPKVARVTASFGFEIIASNPGFAANARALLDGFFAACLMRAFNPGGLKTTGLRRKGYEMWISRDRLLAQPRDVSAVG
jgi:hypothetical protein